MKIVYTIIFWLVFSIIVILTVHALVYSDAAVVKEFSLPLLASIFTVGQLLQNEEKQEFEKKKYIRLRKDKYLDRQIKIVNLIDKYIDDIYYNQLSLPLHNMENEFDYSQFSKIFITLEKYIQTKAALLLDTELQSYIEKIVSILKSMQDELANAQKQEPQKVSDNYPILLVDLFDTLKTFKKEAYKKYNINNYAN